MNGVDCNYYHKLMSPNLVGPGFAADVGRLDGSENVAYMAPIGGYTGQLWRFRPIGDGAYLVSTLYLGTALRASVVDGGPDDGGVRLEPGQTPAQQWVVEPLEVPESFALASSAPVPFVRACFVRLWTRLRGPGWSLDLAVGGAAFVPMLAERRESPGQAWLLARTEARAC